MWPSLLLADPDIARAVLQYRADRVADGKIAAARGGDTGVRFPWEGGLDGFEHTPAVEFGETELHVISDVALAAWQYYLATGDRDWLRSTGSQLIIGAADFWCGRARRGDDGLFHITDVTPPDEWAQAHDDSAYTNVSVAQVCRFATRVAELLDLPPRPEWEQLSEDMYLPYDPKREVTLEHADYTGARIKQADVVMLTYPWMHRQSREQTARNLDYYASKVTEWGGPSMTDAMHAIVSAELGRADDALWYTKRSSSPFLRAPFLQFAEERDGGAFTFVTGAGGFLQIFLYGYSGLRLREDGIDLAPLLPDALEELTLTGLRYRSTVFDVAITPRLTTVTVVEGDPLTVFCDGVARVASVDAPVSFASRSDVVTVPAGVRGDHIVSHRAAPVPASAPAPASSADWPEDAFQVAAVDVYADDETTYFVATMTGEVANPWAGEALSAHELHVYVGDADEQPAPVARFGPASGSTAVPWTRAVVASAGIRQGEPCGTGVYDPQGALLSQARVTVARRQQIVVAVPTAALGGLDAEQALIEVVALDVSGGRPAHRDVPDEVGPARTASVLVTRAEA